MKISIIIPNYNKADFIGETLNSLISQTYVNWEAIIVDDGSTDDSKKIIEKYADSDKRINHIFLEKSKNGGSFCRNVGLNNASGQFVIFLDSDDILSTVNLNTRLQYVSDNFNKYDAWVFPMSLFRETVEDSPDLPFWKPLDNNLLERFLSHDLPWQTMQPIWRKEFVEKVGGFDETYKRYQDVEFHTRALLNGARVSCNTYGEPDCYYRVSNDRIIVDKINFIENKAEGAIKYYIDFFDKVKKKHRKYLSVTLLKGIREVFYFSKSHQIKCSRVIYTIINAEKKNFIKFLLSIYFFTLKNIKFHIPGLEKLFNWLIRISY